MDRLFIGIDTSCYTTSAACVSKDGIVVDKRTVLSVNVGECGLRQSTGVFQHIRNLEPTIHELFDGIDSALVRSVTVSATPRDVEGSYMPVFLTGRTVASAVASALNVPLNLTSHQQGHIRAAMFGNEELLNKELLAVHLSGGTTEVLRVKPYLNAELIGGTGDISAGQFVDRVGVALGLHFPAGKELEKLALSAGDGYNRLPVSVKGCTCSFSGVESMAQRLIAGGESKADVAYAVYDCIARTLFGMICASGRLTGIGDVLITGGVASSPLLRELLCKKLRTKKINIRIYFGQNVLSSDNAVGAALIGMDMDRM